MLTNLHPLDKIINFDYSSPNAFEGSFVLEKEKK